MTRYNPIAPDVRLDRRGIALVPAMLVVSGLVIVTLALMTAVLAGSRTVVHQNEEYQISSSVESVAVLTMERLWSLYVQSQGGAPGDIQSFRGFLAGIGVLDSPGDGLPDPADGTSVTEFLDLPQDGGRWRFDNVNVDAVQLVRRDVGDATQLFLTVQASTKRGEDIVNPVLNRAVQQVYTVEPSEFSGFEYALLANNVNCIFCHTNVDSVDRYWNTDDALRNTFARVKVGTLESLLIRHDVDGNGASVNDFDADSFVAGTLYVRGFAGEEDGNPIDPGDWADQSLMGYAFGPDGTLVEDSFFELTAVPFQPAGDPIQPLENLYLDYPSDYTQMVDGPLPDFFPAPIPDDGGLDPTTGMPDPGAKGNRIIDDIEFDRVAAEAYGEITAGIVNLTPPTEVIDTPLEYAGAVIGGNRSGTGIASNGGAVEGNVILTGWPDNPIQIDGTLVIDGDLIIQGYVRGEGTIYVRGNVYIPSSLMYADGRQLMPGDDPDNPTGPRTFGIAPDGTTNALGLTAGGNILIGDFQRPASLQPDFSWDPPDAMEIISGNPDTGDVMTDAWSFALAEISLFNRAEWTRTQPVLPDATGALVPNPTYDPTYVPRYYHYGEDTLIPIYNQGDQYFDPTSRTWITPNPLDEVPLGWDPARLTYADPTDPSDPILFAPDGTPKAVTSAVTHTGGWMDPEVYKAGVEYFESIHPGGTPFQIDGLLYTNNAIFGIVNRDTPMQGQMLVNGGLVAADIGLLVPGRPGTAGDPNRSPLSGFAIGLQLNYDQRTKSMLRVTNPLQIQLKRTFWNPTANLF